MKMNKLTTKVLILLGFIMLSFKANAQLSSNPDKFLGNITSGGEIDCTDQTYLDNCGEKFYELWNQITPENESKWGSIEGWTGWDACTNIYNYAKENNIPFKFHTLVWGSQYPEGIKTLSNERRYKRIVKWMDKVKEHYPDLQMIDVVNEAVRDHQEDTHYFQEALGGEGETGYDWIINAFELAYERWPDAILIYNDFNTFQWDTDQYIALVKTLRDAGAPIDAYGCQSHDLKGVSLSNLEVVDTKIQNALKMPMYISEYDIQNSNDDAQLTDFKNHIPYFWEKDYCAGITLWGYIYGKTWNENKSGLIKNGKDRKAMTWLREYMKSDAAKNAKSPFPGMVKEASVYIKPASLKVKKGESLPIEIRAKLKTKTIDHIDLYVQGELYKTLNAEPYITEFVSEKRGKYELKAVAVATDGTKYERYSEFTVKGTTGIDNVTAGEKTGKTYNLKGQQTNANHKGIVIKNGKKYINK